MKNILVIDVGGTNVKISATGREEVRKIPSGPEMTAEDIVANRLERKKWQAAVEDATARLKAALVAEYVVLGGGNAKQLERLPSGARLGDNHHAFVGDFRLWDR
jgi:polyphosphate glucokinase